MQVFQLFVFDHIRATQLIENKLAIRENTHLFTISVKRVYRTAG